MDDLRKITKIIRKFRDEREWKQFHNPKDMALSLVLEAGEVMEHFQWKNELEVDKYLRTNKSLVAEELADVFYWVLLMSSDLGIDIKKSIIQKIDKNKEKYPVRRAKGNNTKYNKL
jgi:NTP pyrophosphatase (non-canonical NTP hydrolase)